MLPMRSPSWRAKGGVADAYVQAVPEREPRKLRNIGRIDAA